MGSSQKYISIHDTHAYPGCHATVMNGELETEDNFNSIVEFSDGTTTPSLWESLDGRRAVLHVAGYMSAKGTRIPDRILTLQQTDQEWKIVSSRKA